MVGTSKLGSWNGHWFHKLSTNLTQLSVGQATRRLGLCFWTRRSVATRSRSTVITRRTRLEVEPTEIWAEWGIRYVYPHIYILYAYIYMYIYIMYDLTNMTIVANSKKNTFRRINITLETMLVFSRVPRFWSMSVLCDRIDIKNILMKTRVDTDLHHFLTSFLKVLCKPKGGNIWTNNSSLLHWTYWWENKQRTTSIIIRI